MKLSFISLALLVIIGFSMVQESEAWGWGGLGGWGWGGPWGGLGWGGGWGGGFGGWGGGFGGWNRWGWGGWWKRSAESSALPPLECSYGESSKLLACKIVGKPSIDCAAVRVFDEKLPTQFLGFAISAAPFGGLQTKPEEVKYSLYPAKLDRSGFFDTRVLVSEKSFSYSLYHLESYTDFGLRVTEPGCWKRVLDLFSEVSQRFDTIPVEMEGGKTESVRVIGRFQIL